VTQMPRKLSWNPALEGIRGCAVLLVLMFHFLTRADPNRGLRAIPFKVAMAGWCGVDLFFVLSGYLITTILLQSKESPNYFRGFYSRRVRRIFPLYYGVLAITLLIIPALDHLRTAAVSRVLHDQWYFWLYVSNFLSRSADADWLNLGHFWSLAIEEQFYLLWPAIIFFSSRKRAIHVALSALILSISLRVGLQLVAISDPFLGKARHWAFAWTPCRLDSLAIGALIALLSLDPDARRVLEQFARRATVVIAPIMIWLTWRGFFTDALGAPNSIPQFALDVLIYTLLAFAFGTLVVEATRSDQSWLTRLLAFRPFRFLGKYSYGIYVFQGLLAPLLSTWLPPARLNALLGSSDAGAYAYFALSLVPILAISVLSWHVYERRFLTPSSAIIPPAP
jgi:peptidoglycan/LPS O-acetylase OafA/YrhL